VGVLLTKGGEFASSTQASIEAPEGEWEGATTAPPGGAAAALNSAVAGARGHCRGSQVATHVAGSGAASGLLSPFANEFHGLWDGLAYLPRPVTGTAANELDDTTHRHIALREIYLPRKRSYNAVRGRSVGDK
jgi:hypothetical protein